MSKISILISAPIDFAKELKEEILSDTDTVTAYGASQDEVKKILKENKFDAWLCSPCPTYLINKDMLSLCPSIKCIATPSTGTNHIELSDCDNLSIKVFSLKNSEVVGKIHASSEFTFGLMLSVIRNLPQARQSVLDGKWRESENLFRGRELDSLSLGIIGLGRIGGNLARYSEAFGMDVSYYDPYVTSENKSLTKIDNYYDLVSNVDVLVVCVHLDSLTRNMVNKDTFGKMRKGSFFINTSRGEIVNEQALLHALNSGQLAAAGVDVISDEFLSKKDLHPLVAYAREHSNLIITPHIAGLTFDSERKAQTASFKMIKEFINRGSNYK